MIPIINPPDVPASDLDDDTITSNWVGDFVGFGLGLFVGDVGLRDGIVEGLPVVGEKVGNLEG